MPPISACSLHVPYKEWSTSHEEKTNYDVLERWGQQILSCYPPGRGSVFSATNRAWFSGNVTVPVATTLNVDFNTLTRTDTLGTHITLPSPGLGGYILGADGILYVVISLAYPAFTANQQINNELDDYDLVTNFNFGGAQPAVQWIMSSGTAGTTDTFGVGGGYYIIHSNAGTPMNLFLRNPLPSPLTVALNIGITLMELA